MTVSDTLPGSALVGLAAEDMARLHHAYRQLEHPSLAARLSSVVGTPIEIAIKLLPQRWHRGLHATAEKAIGKAFDVATSSMRLQHEHGAHEGMYRGLVGSTGAVGGLLGLPGLVIELPVTTTIMLRSIAEIARQHGEDLHDLKARLACLQVFVLGGHTETDDAAETGYYGVRLALAAYMSGAVAQVSQHGLTGEGAPLVVQLVRYIAAGFGADVSRRAAARLLPMIGAVGAAAVNMIFMQHYQDMARGHFTVRELERRYGEALVRASYEQLSQSA